MSRGILALTIALTLLVATSAWAQPRAFLDLSPAQVADSTVTPNLPTAPVTTLEVAPGALVRVTVGLQFQPTGDVTRWYLFSALLNISHASLQVVTPNASDIAANAFWHPQVAERGLRAQTRAAVSSQTPPLRANLLRPDDSGSPAFSSSGALWVVLAPGGSANTEPLFVGHAYLRVADDAPDGVEIPLTLISVVDGTLSVPNSLLVTDGARRYHRFGEHLPVQAATLRVRAAQTELEGTVQLGDYLASPEGVQLELQIREPGTTTPLQTHTVTLDAQGRFRLSTRLQGAHDLSLKGGHWLRQTLANVNLRGRVQVTFSLQNGDVDGDNEVSLLDFGALVAAFGSTPDDGAWNPNADLDGDEEVNLLDFGILVRQFGAAGDD
ncbi:MAG: dockerin type I domain-containing protein [Armatimonadota bacterium]|nr:dockerin type I domain-containing protein [Armatimonadota bacterium]